MTGPHTLSAKRTRRMARDTGIPTITRAWNLRGPEYYWATWDHEHGFYNMRTGEVEYEKGNKIHHPSCYGPGHVLLVELEPFDNDGRWPIQGEDR